MTSTRGLSECVMQSVPACCSRPAVRITPELRTLADGSPGTSAAATAARQ